MSIPNNSIVQSPIPSVPLQAGHAQDLSAPFVKSDKRGGTFQSNENFTVLALKVGSFMTDFKEIFAAGVAIATYIFLDFYEKDFKKNFSTSLALAEISIFLVRHAAARGRCIAPPDRLKDLLNSNSLKTSSSKNSSSGVGKDASNALNPPNLSSPTSTGPGSELQKKPLVNLESGKALALVPTGLLKA